MIFLIETKDCPGVDWTNEDELLKSESRHVWELCKSGIIRNIWFTKQDKDAILLMECSSLEEAKSIMKQFPLVKTGKITFLARELISYDGFERLMIL